MQIQNFPPRNLTPIKELSNNRHVINLKSQNDTVSFKGTAEKSNETIRQAENFGLNLYALYQNGKFTHQTIQEEARKNIPSIQVKDIGGLKEVFGKNIDVSRYNAYLMPAYQNNCKLKTLTMFLPQNKPSIRQIGSAAHEYTHALQYTKSDDYMGIAPHANNDLLKARALNSLSFYVFNEIEKNLKQGEIFDEAALISETEGKSPKDALMEVYGCKDSKECRRIFKRIFNATYESINSELKEGKDYDKYMPYKDDPLKLKRTVKEICVSKAQREKEAYTVQKNVISSIDKGELTSENKINPAFYELIIETLS